MLYTTLLLPLAASASVLQERQAGIGSLLGGGSPAKVISEKLQPRYRKTANRNLYKVGPFSITGSTAGGRDSTFQGQGFFPSIAPGSFCNKPGSPCTILAGHVGLEFADPADKGKKADPSNGIYIHHILTSDMTKKQTPWLSNCGSSTRSALNIAGLLGGTAFVGTGEDGAEQGAVYTSEDGTRDSGYHVGENDKFQAWAQLVNYNAEAKKVYVTYDIEWVPGITGDDVKTATFTATCGTSPMIKLSESGPTNTTSGKFTFLEDGKILGGRGHLHDGGVQMDLIINDKLVCVSEAIYGDSTAPTEMGGMGGHAHGAADTNAPAAPKSSVAIKTITSMTTCQGPIPVKKGDTLKMNAVYDLKKHPLRVSLSGSKASDVMGMMGISFAASKK